MRKMNNWLKVGLVILVLCIMSIGIGGKGQNKGVTTGSSGEATSGSIRVYDRDDPRDQGKTIGDWTDLTTLVLNTDVEQTVYCQKNGITIDGNGHTLSGTGYALYLGGREGINIMNCNFVGSRYAIRLYICNNITIRENNFEDNFIAIDIYHSSYNIIDSNRLTQVIRAIQIYNGENNEITGNEIIGRESIYLKNANNNKILYNRISGIKDDYWGWVRGIMLTDSSNNEIRGCFITEVYIGIYILRGGSNQITWCSITHCTRNSPGGDGLYLSTTACNTIENCLIAYCTLGVYLHNSPDNHFSTLNYVYANDTEWLPISTIPDDLVIGVPPPPPTVYAVTPDTGAEGDEVTITVDNIWPGSTATFDANQVTAIQIPDSTTMTVTVPEGTGTVDVTATNVDSQNGVLTAGFAYISTAPTIEELTALVIDSYNKGLITDETYASLLDNLYAAQDSSDRGNLNATIGQLTAFSNHTRAQRGKGIDEQAAQTLLDYEDDLIDYLTLPSKLPVTLDLYLTPDENYTTIQVPAGGDVTTVLNGYFTVQIKATDDPAIATFNITRSSYVGTPLVVNGLSSDTLYFSQDPDNPSVGTLNLLTGEVELVERVLVRSSYLDALGLSPVALEIPQIGTFWPLSLTKGVLSLTGAGVMPDDLPILGGSPYRIRCQCPPSPPAPPDLDDPQTRLLGYLETVGSSLNRSFPTGYNDSFIEVITSSWYISRLNNESIVKILKSLKQLLVYAKTSNAPEGPAGALAFIESIRTNFTKPGEVPIVFDDEGATAQDLYDSLQKEGPGKLQKMIDGIWDLLGDLE